MQTAPIFRPVLLILVFLAGLPVAALQAQQADGLVQLEVVALAEFDMPPLFYQSGVEPGYQPLKVGRNSRGSVNDWRPGSNLVLYRRETNAEGQEVYQQVVSLDAPSGGKRRILFFYRGPTGAFSHRFVDDDYARFGPSTARFINLTESEVVCMLEDQRVRVGAKDEAVREPDVSLEERFRFTFQLLDADRMQVRAPVRTLRFVHEQMRLAFVFAYEAREIVDDRGRRQVVYRPQAVRLYDFVPGGE